MIVAQTIAEVRKHLKKERDSDNKIALVPTMGALHDGHLSLIKKAQEVADYVIVSLFVNKTQFNDIGDYEKYPRQTEEDLKILATAGVDIVFTPQDHEMFPHKPSFKIAVENLSDCLCGKSRPGHFDGVAMIITKLFNIIGPDVAIFGEKDFQQLAIIKQLVQDFNFDVKVISATTMRHDGGLAMSSRNQRLSISSRVKAEKLFEILSQARAEIQKSPDQIIEILHKKQQELLAYGFDSIDYLEVRTESDLKLVTKFDSKLSARIFVAVYLDKIRLIDNTIL